MDPIGKKLLDVIRDEVGYKEKGDGYTKFGDWYGKNVDKEDPGYFTTAPWCDMFLAWAADQAEVTDSAGQFASTIEHAKWFREQDAWGRRPEAGAIVFFDWSGSRDIDMIDHVGIVERVEGDQIHTIEANVDGVHLKRKVRTEDSIVGYGYPGKVKVAKTAVASTATLPAGGKNDTETGYAPKHAAPPPTLKEILDAGSAETAEQSAGTATPDGKTEPVKLPTVDTAALTGMLGVILVGTAVLAVGKAAGKARTPQIAMPALSSPVRVRKRGRHHRTEAPVELPADLTPVDLEMADAGTVMMPALSAAVAAQAEDREFWGRIEHLKEDDELAFWDSLHDAVSTSGHLGADRIRAGQR